MKWLRRSVLFVLIASVLLLGSISHVMACAQCNNFATCEDKCENWTPRPGMNFSIRYVPEGTYWGCVDAPDFPEFTCSETGPTVTCGSTITYDQPGCTGNRIGTGVQERRTGEGDDCD